MLISDQIIKCADDDEEEDEFSDDVEWESCLEAPFFFVVEHDAGGGEEEKDPCDEQWAPAKMTNEIDGNEETGEDHPYSAEVGPGVQVEEDESDESDPE